MRIAVSAKLDKFCVRRTLLLIGIAIRCLQRFVRTLRLRLDAFSRRRRWMYESWQRGSVIQIRHWSSENSTSMEMEVLGRAKSLLSGTTTRALLEIYFRPSSEIWQSAPPARILNCCRL